MAATFDPALPSLLDHVRLALGDKHSGATAGNVPNPLLQDETINGKLVLFGYAEALAQLADALVSEVSQRPDAYSESGGVSIRWGERIAAWKELAKNARAGNIKLPNTRRIARPGIAVQEMEKQAMTTRTARTDSTTPTLMEGFRAD